MTGLFQPVASIESNPLVADTYEEGIRAPVLRKRISGDEADDILRLARVKGYNKIDVVVGGPPCRPFSLSNRGGTRWEEIKKLQRINNHPDWQIFLRLVRQLQPRIVVAENVMGFASRVEVFSKFVEGMRDEGYTVATPTLHSEDFGVPQKRKRIFIIALNGSLDKEMLVPRIPENLRVVTVGEAISDLPRITNERPGSIEAAYKKVKPTPYETEMRGSSKILLDHVVHSAHPTMARRFQYIEQGSSLISAWRERKIPRSVLQARYVRGSHSRKGFSKSTLSFMHSNIYRRLRWNAPSPTITHVRKSVLLHPRQDRLLSVREAARLQSFPDWFRFRGSISLQYQQVADAVPPMLARAIAIHLASLIQSERTAPVIEVAMRV